LFNPSLLSEESSLSSSCSNFVSVSLVSELDSFSVSLVSVVDSVSLDSSFVDSSSLSGSGALHKKHFPSTNPLIKRNSFMKYGII